MRIALLMLGLCCSGLFANDGGPAPAPEPGTILMLTVGLAGIGYAAWRKNRKR